MPIHDDTYHLYHTLKAQGFALERLDDGHLQVSPAAALTDELREKIRAHRDELVQLIPEPPNDDTSNRIRGLLLAWSLQRSGLEPATWPTLPPYVTEPTSGAWCDFLWMATTEQLIDAWTVAYWSGVPEVAHELPAEAAS